MSSLCRRVVFAAALGSLAIPIGSAALAGASNSTSVGDAQLTGTYSVSFHIVLPLADRRDRTTLNIGFTPACNSGPCDVTVSTLANSCVSGSCGQPPSDLTFAEEPLRLSDGEYKGTFTIKTGCTARGTYFPYAYEQRTLMTIKPTTAQNTGGALQVARFVGSLQLFGTPDATGHKFHCSSYRFALDLAGTTNS